MFILPQTKYCTEHQDYLGGMGEGEQWGTRRGRYACRGGRKDQEEKGEEELQITVTSLKSNRSFFNKHFVTSFKIISFELLKQT